MDAKSSQLNGPVLAVDWGEHTAGIAVSPDGVHAFPRKSLSFNKEEELLQELKRIIEEDAIAHIVVGLPLTLQGDEKQMALRVRSFGSRLENISGIAVHYQDERLSSQFAQDKLIAGSRMDSDSLAACAILDNFLAKR